MQRCFFRAYRVLALYPLKVCAYKTGARDASLRQGGIRVCTVYAWISWVKTYTVRTPIICSYSEEMRLISMGWRVIMKSLCFVKENVKIGSSCRSFRGAIWYAPQNLCLRRFLFPRRTGLVSPRDTNRFFHPDAFYPSPRDHQSCKRFF